MSGNKKDGRELYNSAQRRLVAALLCDATDVSRVLELITSEDLEEPTCHLIFTAIAEISRRNEQVSVVPVAKELQDQGVLEKVGGTKTLFALTVEGEQYLTEAPATVYARIVKESSAKSKISSSLKKSYEDFREDSGIQAVDGIVNLQSELNNTLLKLGDASTATKFDEGIDDYFDMLEERRRVQEENKNTSDGLQGLPSLLPTLNKYTSGWLPGQMITVGARTGVGKSIFAVNCATAAAKANATVMFFSLEMSKEQLQDRIVSSTTGFSSTKLKHGDLSDEEMVELKNKRDELSQLKIVIDTEPKITVDMIRARALRQAQSEQGLDFIIIDYLQLVTPAGRFHNRQEAVADISRNVKLLAKQLEVPIMVLVQLNRNTNKEDEDAFPELDQIRESGAIGQDSDIVILLHRKKSYDEITPPTYVILAKNRDGQSQKTITCHSNLDNALFLEMRRTKTDDNEEEEDGFDGDDLAQMDDDLDYIGGSVEY